MAYGIARVAAALAAATAIAGCGAGASGGPSAARVAAELKGSPPPLAALHRQAGQILTGGVAAFRARLRALEGYPVVVMQWSSWCDGCAADLRYFRVLSAQLGRRVAFIGVDVQDSASAARHSLRSTPVSFPSYADHGRSIALMLNVEWSQFAPVTFFYTRSGVQESSAGPFLSERSLRREIRQYTGV
jgi:cytochrome c biogenesis protein CcmG/thiol:disulfide interchange protein DsbE